MSWSGLLSLVWESAWSGCQPGLGVGLVYESAWSGSRAGPPISNIVDSVCILCTVACLGSLCMCWIGFMRCSRLACSAWSESEAGHLKRMSMHCTCSHVCTIVLFYTAVMGCTELACTAWSGSEAMSMKIYSSHGVYWTGLDNLVWE